jgi:hypothetical protein
MKDPIILKNRNVSPPPAKKNTSKHHLLFKKKLQKTSKYHLHLKKLKNTKPLSPKSTKRSTNHHQKTPTKP